MRFRFGAIGWRVWVMVEVFNSEHNVAEAKVFRPPASGAWSRERRRRMPLVPT
jgi:hypothetical protein